MARKTMPLGGLGPVNRPGDRARLEDRAIKQAQAKARAVNASKPLSERVGKPKGRVAQAQTQMARMAAPTPSVAPNRAGASYVPGSKADMAYTGVKAGGAPSPKAPPRMRKMGTGVTGAAMTAAAGAGLAAYDKFRNRDRKRVK